MADENITSADTQEGAQQQASDAQLLDDLTSLQQATEGLDEAQADGQVATNNEGDADNPSMTRPDDEFKDSRGLPEGGTTDSFALDNTDLANSNEQSNTTDTQFTAQNTTQDATAINLDNVQIQLEGAEGQQGSTTGGTTSGAAAGAPSATTAPTAAPTTLTDPAGSSPTPIPPTTTTPPTTSQPVPTTPTLETPPSGSEDSDGGENSANNFLPSLTMTKVATGIGADALATATPIATGQTGVVTAAGQVIYYTITVENTGNQPLTGITVTDPLADAGSVIKASGDTDNDNVLDVGETWTYTAKHTVTPAEFDAGGNYDSADTDTVYDQFRNIATADSVETGPDTDDAVVTVTESSLNITKTATGIGADALATATPIATGQTGVVTAAGQVIYYTITVENTGNQPLTGITVTDPLADAGSVIKASGDTDNDNVLDVGETWTYTAKHTVTPAEFDAGGNYDSADTDTVYDQFRNIATADSVETGPDTDDAVVTVTESSLNITKTATGIGADALATATPIATGQTGVVTAAGQVIYYTITVENTGNQPLTGITVTDPLADAGSVIKASGDTDNDNVLDVGETWTYTAKHTVTPAEFDAGGNYDSADTDTVYDQFRNIATADSVETGPDTDDAVVTVTESSLNITKTATGIGADALATATPIATGQTGVVTAAGQVIYYTITVENTGNQPLTGITVTDPLADAGSVIKASGDTDNDNVLDVGETWTYTAKHTVTPAEFDAGGNYDSADTDTVYDQFRNIATADSVETGPDTDDAVVTVTESSLNITKTATGIGADALATATPIATGQTGVVTAAGQVIYYTITVENTGNQPLTGITVTDPLADAGSVIKASGDTDNDNVLDVGETWTYTAKHTVTPAEFDAGGNYDSADTDTVYDQFRNIATADSVETGPDTDDAVVTVTESSLNITKTATGIGADALATATPIATGQTGVVTAAGQVIYYTITVENTGNQPLTGITVTDPLADAGSVIKASGDTDNDNVLDVGETWTYTAKHTVTPAEFDAGGNYDSADTDTVYDQFRNIATADSVETGPDTDDAVVTVTESSLNITKTATGIGADALATATPIATGQTGVVTAAGQVIYYTITVENTGNQPLTGITVTDPLADAGSVIKASGDTDNDNVLDVGETWTYTAKHTVTPAEFDAGGNYDSADTDTVYDQFRNIATADSVETGPDTDDAVVTVTESSLNITKTATGIGADALATATPIATGQTGVVTAAGQVIYYTITVENTGNQPLTGITVTDPLADAGSVIKASGDTDNDNVLDVGETWTYTAKHTVTPAEFDAGGNYDSADTDTVYDQFRNIATADSVETGPDTDDAVVTVTESSLNITKTATGIGADALATATPIATGQTGVVTAAGQVIYYTITVENTGNQPLTGITVTDPLADAGSVIKASGDTDNDNVLDVGETWTYTAKHTVTPAEFDAGGNYDSADTDTVYDQFRNIATADSVETGPDTDDAVVTVTESSLNITKTATGIGADALATATPIATGQTGVVTAAGQVIYYTITVENTGNQPLTGITVTDPLADAGSVIKASGDTDNDNVLDVGETWTYTAKHTVTPAEFDAGGNYDSADTDTVYDQFRNIATADSVETGPDTDDAVVTVTESSLNITKTATGIGADALATATPIATGQTGVVTAAGQVIYYTITVENTGNQPLTGITVTDPLADAGSVIKASGDTDNDNVLDVGETWTYTAKHTVTPAEFDAGGNYDSADTDTVYDQFRNIATADSVETGPDTDDAVVTVTESSLNITKTATGIGADALATATPIATGQTGVVTAAGQVIYYTITVENTGNQPLTGITVTDPLADAGSVIKASGDTDNDNVLDVGETWTYTAKHTVTPAEFDAGGNYDSADTDTVYDQFRNIATADSVETGPDTDDAVVTVTESSLNITKTATGIGADALATATPIATGQTGVVTAAGQVIYYTITVENTGNQPLTGITVTDPLADAGSVIKASGDTDNDNVLDVGETWTYTAKHTVTPAEFDAGGNYDSADTDTVYDQFRNIATADSVETGPDTDDAVVTVTESSLNITKTATGIGADALATATPIATGQTGVVTAAGQVIYYTITVENTGNQPLTGITVTDPLADAGSVIKASGDTDNDNVLDVGETWTYTAKHTVTPAEFDAGGNYDSADTDTVYDQFRNIATADSVETGPDTDDAVVTFINTPELTIVKTARVTSDAIGGINENSQNAVTNNKVDSVGDVITYTLTLINVGNVSLNTFSIDDTMFANGRATNIKYFVDSDADNIIDSGELIGTLAIDNKGKVVFPSNYQLSPGGEVKIQYDVTVLQSDLDAGLDLGELVMDIDNTMSATAQDLQGSKVIGDSVTGGIGDTVVSYEIPIVGTYADVAIRKIAHTQYVSGVGDKVAYELIVTNEGTSSLTGVSITDTKFVGASDFIVIVHNPDGTTVSQPYTISGTSLTIGNLAVGSYVTVDYIYTVQSSDYTVTSKGITQSVIDYTDGNGNQGHTIDFGYGSFAAYVDTNATDPYSTANSISADVFVNVDNTGVAVGVNAGVMSGDKNYNSDHLVAVFSPSSVNNNKSLVDTAVIKFTNATDCEVAFKVVSGSINGIGGTPFVGSVLISSSGNTVSVALKQVTGSPGNYNLIGTTTPGVNTYSFDGVPGFTVSVADGPGGAQNKIYTLSYNPGMVNGSQKFIDSFDFWVVGDLKSNALEQIKVVDVEFNTLDFSATLVKNTAIVYSLEDGANDQSDEISTVETAVVIQGADTPTGFFAALDKIGPTAIISLLDDNLSVGETSIVKIKFSEAIKGFDLADLNASNGQLTNLTGPFVNGDGTVSYQALFTPNRNVNSSSNKISLGSGYTDIAGNAGATADSQSYIINTVVPDIEAELTDRFMSFSWSKTNSFLTINSNSIAVQDDNNLPGEVVLKSFVLQKGTAISGTNPTQYNYTNTNISPELNGTEVKFKITQSGKDFYRIVMTTTDIVGGTSEFISDAFEFGQSVRDYVTDGTFTFPVLGTPITLDLNKDSIEYLSTSAGVTYDYNGDGIAESTAWVSPEDGLLALSQEDGSLKIVFSTQDGETDLQGLAKIYDSNQDGQLDELDTFFNQFGVWQDADSDGVVDAGEFQSLTDRDIVSLDLVSDGIDRTEANGDVFVYGQTTYTKADGTTGLADDAAFVVRSSDEVTSKTIQIGNSGEVVHVPDFGTNDQIDLSTILANAAITRDNLKDYVQLVDGENGTVLNIDTTGHGGEGGWVQVASLDNVHVSQTGVNMFFDPTNQTIDFTQSSPDEWKVEDGDTPV